MVDLETRAPEIEICLAQQMSYIMIFFSPWLLTKAESYQNLMVCLVINNVGFSMIGKIIL
jgi:hypothetical protein